MVRFLWSYDGSYWWPFFSHPPLAPLLFPSPLRLSEVHDSDYDLFCFHTSDKMEIDMATIGRFPPPPPFFFSSFPKPPLLRTRLATDSVYFAGCFEEITYVHCTAFYLTDTESELHRGRFYWTSRKEPLR